MGKRDEKLTPMSEEKMQLLSLFANREFIYSQFRSLYDEITNEIHQQISTALEAIADKLRLEGYLQEDELEIQSISLFDEEVIIVSCLVYPPEGSEIQTSDGQTVKIEEDGEMAIVAQIALPINVALKSDKDEVICDLITLDDVAEQELSMELTDEQQEKLKLFSSLKGGNG